MKIKRLPALLLAAAMMFTLLSAMPSNAFAANYDVSISGLSTESKLVSTIASGLRKAKSGDTVTVTGSATTDYTVDINIPAGVTLIWKAKLSSTYIAPPGFIYSGLLNVRGSGTLEITDGADLSMYSPVNGNIAINVYEATANININGGKVASYANSGFACHTIGSSGSNVNLNVGGNAVVIAEAYGRGTANAIDFENSVGNVVVSGNASIKATSESNDDNVVAIAYTVGKAIGDITINGGTIEVSSKRGSAAGIYTPSGNITINGGNISVSTAGGSGKSTEALRLGDNDLVRNIGPVGSVNITGGNISVSNNCTSGGLAFGVGVYNHDDNVTITGGTMTVAANGSGGGAYGVFYQNDAATSVRGNVTMTGGTITSTAAQHAYGIRLADGTVSVTGGSVSASSSLPGWAAYVQRRGVIAFLKGTYTGILVVDNSASGIAVEVDNNIVPIARKGTSTGITLVQFKNIAEAKAMWDNTLDSAASPHIIATGTGSAGIPKAQFGSYQGAANRDLVTAFVTRLYINVLNRDPRVSDIDSLNAWVDRLISKQQSGTSIVFEFYFCKEFVDKKISDDEFIENLYLTMMNRPSDPAGKAKWVNDLKTGMSRRDVVQSFVDSVEWGDNCVKYGIDR